MDEEYFTHEYKHWGSITNVMITEGNAKDEFMRNDGLHPNDDGLALILDYIRTHRYIPSP